MTEWAEHGKYKTPGMRKGSTPGLGGNSVAVREEIMRRALEELEHSSAQVNEKQTRETIIQSIAETRQALGQKVDLGQIEKMIDRIGEEIEREEALAREKEEAIERERQLRKENRMPWYVWVIIALVLSPLLLFVIRIGAIFGARIARVMF